MAPKKQLVDLDGRMVQVSPLEPVAYLAETYADLQTLRPETVDATSNRDEAWSTVRQEIENGGHGHVLIYDVTFPDNPKRIRCLGRIDAPTQEQPFHP